MTKLLLSVSLLITFASTLYGAGGGSTVTLLTRVDSLPPGTRVEVEMRAQYAVLNWQAGAGERRSGPVEEFILKSPTIFKWSFVADQNGTAPERKVAFQFERRLIPLPEKGMSASIQFPITFRIVCPAGAKNCNSRSRETQFGMQLRSEEKDDIVRCLSLRPTGSDIIIGVGRTCNLLTEPGLKVIPATGG